MKERLFIPIAIALIILMAYNVAIAFAATKMQRQHLLSAIEHLPASTDCLFLGNSLMEAGCDPGAFESSWAPTNSSPMAANLGLGATTPVEHYLILKQALSRPVAAAPTSLRYPGSFEVITATNTGAVVQRYMDKLLESSTVP